MQEARDKHGLTALALLAVSPSKVDDSDLDDSKDSGSGTKGTAKGKLEIPLPVFTGKRLDLYARDFVRYLRMTGQKAADEMPRADLIVTGCKNEWPSRGGRRHLNHVGIMGTEAVPRTPWPGYGIQPVSGPLTPCTACSVP